MSYTHDTARLKLVIPASTHTKLFQCELFLYHFAFCAFNYFKVKQYCFISQLHLTQSHPPLGQPCLSDGVVFIWEDLEEHSEKNLADRLGGNMASPHPDAKEWKLDSALTRKSANLCASITFNCFSILTFLYWKYPVKYTIKNNQHGR